MGVADGATIALIGIGSIGVSFAALYLKHSKAHVHLYDPRPDLDEHLRSVLPVYLDTSDVIYDIDALLRSKRLQICSSIEAACKGADIVQEQGPENLSSKTNIWTQIVEIVSRETHLWSSTSGIPASKQAAELPDTAQRRLMVIHPFNPPHIMPLLELVPSPLTALSEIDFAKTFFRSLNSGHQPVVVHKELPGFVGNRLAFVLLREACHLVDAGVVSIEDLDAIVETSLGPRWAVTGPFRSYHYGGGTKGLRAFFNNLSGTIEDVWVDAGQKSFQGTSFLQGAATHADDTSLDSWADRIVHQTNQAYGLPTTSDFAERDKALKNLLQARGFRTG